MEAGAAVHVPVLPAAGTELGPFHVCSPLLARYFWSPHSVHGFQSIYLFLRVYARRYVCVSSSNIHTRLPAGLSLIHQITLCSSSPSHGLSHPASSPTHSFSPLALLLDCGASGYYILSFSILEYQKNGR